MPKPEQELLPLSYVAQRLGVSVPTVRRLMDSKRLEAINLFEGVTEDHERADGTTYKRPVRPCWRITHESVERLVGK